MKKNLIILIGLLLILTGCKKEEVKEQECPKQEKELIVEYKDNYVMLTINNENITATDVVEIYNQNNYEILFNNIKAKLLKKEMSKEIKAAEKYVEETLKQYESYYGTLTEHYLIESGNCKTFEECKEIIKINYLENQYMKEYIENYQKNLKSDPTIPEDDLETYYFYTCYIEAMTALFDKYQVTIIDTKLNKAHNNYINDLKLAYEEKINTMKQQTE